MSTNVINIDEHITRDNLAVELSKIFMDWDQLRTPKLNEWRELTQFVFATDTKTTTVGETTPWKNNTTIPKMTQIRDNLHANLLKALMPNDRWYRWMADSKEAATIQKRATIQAYIDNKIRKGGFEEELSKLLLDYIDYGNCFAMVEYINDVVEADGEEIVNYVGPKVKRISPYDIVFNPTSVSFEKSPKFIRCIKTLGDLKREIEDDPSKRYLEGAFKEAMEARKTLSGLSNADKYKGATYRADGFGDIQQYWDTERVELIELWGDYYDVKEDKLYKNHIITIIDRSFILRKIENPSWFGHAPIYHAGYRSRPDNLYHMGPLDNLVGMQFMIDKLQNAKADIYDQIIHPQKVIQGDVEEPDYEGPGAKWYVGDEGSVINLAPDATALTADTQIAILEQKMEEMAGAPRQKLGLRTPGEKTKFEVQVLEGNSDNIYLHHAALFERRFLEKLLNEMLQQGRRNMTLPEEIRLQSEKFNIDVFRTITKEDITAKGQLRPIGARHIAERANKVQELVTVFGSVLQSPLVAPHVSGLRFGRLITEMLDLQDERLVEENIAIAEQQQTQRTANVAQENLEVEQLTPQPEDLNAV